jgi:hypothetical protein
LLLARAPLARHQPDVRRHLARARKAAHVIERGPRPLPPSPAPRPAPFHLRFPTRRSSRPRSGYSLASIAAQSLSARPSPAPTTSLDLVRATCRLAASHQPRNTCPGSAPVYTPASNTTAPFTTVAT